jgi:hypothetical protein
MPKTPDGKLDVDVVVGTLARSSGTPGKGRRSPLAASDPVALRKDLEDSNWKDLPPGGAKLDFSRTIPRLLVRTARGTRFAALVSVTQETGKGGRSYTITDAGGVMLLNNAADGSLSSVGSMEAFETRTQGKQQVRELHFISGSAGEYIDESGEIFRGLVLHDEPSAP